MKKEKTLKISGVVLIGLGLGLLLNFSQQGDTKPGPEGSVNSQAVNWQNFSFQTVEDSENFTVSGLEKPVLIETFAVWCTTCSRQQQEIKKLHEDLNVTSVSLNVDPNENAGKVIDHKQENGFDWRYAVAPVEVTNALRTEFGNSVANPPSAPVILVCGGEAVRLEKEGLGSPVKSSDFLAEEIRDRCEIDLESNSRSGSGAVT